ncbi:MAG: serine protein kinase PrkA [Bacteroidetes bacterium]|nr:serine protein kinase PrkA [Bacteroidota bacterium]
METYKALQEKAKRLEALIKLSRDMRDKETRIPVTFNDFLYLTAQNPRSVLRDIFQLFYDMVKYYIPDGEDEYNVTKDSVGFVAYDCSGLFQADCDEPFFADRLFANRFMNLVNGFRKGIQNNRIYLFEGPPGSGKSTFLNNLLNKLERYTNLPEGYMYNTFWRLDAEKLGGFSHLERTINIIGESTDNETYLKQLSELPKPLRWVDVSCPNQDHPILQIPKAYRKNLLDELIPDEKFKERLFHDKTYEWVLKDTSCGICNSIYTSLMDQIGNPLEVFNMLYARKSNYTRQFGEGISIFNPGDPTHSKPITNQTLQDLINRLLKNDSVRFIYSYLANTNNGVFALMDIKENNIERLMGLHGIISDGVHKVELIEERIKSLFIGLVNPEDKKHYEDVKSFRDRIITVNIPYVLDYNTEVAIYKEKFGREIADRFLPRVLNNFAKIIISTRMDKDSQAIKKWIADTTKYSKYVDKDLLLLKMSIYTGKIPDWLKEEDIRHFDKPTRKAILDDSEKEGKTGYSGRQSLSIFNAFLSKNSDKSKLITMEMVRSFFETNSDILDIAISKEFMDSLLDWYNYNVLQEVKEAIYYYNKNQITRDIKNYLFAINFDLDETVRSEYTGDNIEITEEYFKNFEALFLGTTSTLKERQAFRRDIQSEYITKTLAQEINLKGKEIEQTELFETLLHKYTRNLKENALAPYHDNENFRRAVMEYNLVEFNKYDRRLKRDINRLITNLETMFEYTGEGAKQVSLYVLDNALAKKY